MDLSVIIVSWNVGGLLAKCLTALRNAQAGLKMEVIVVDNNSSDETIEILENNFSDVTLIKSDYNAGYAKAANQAINKASGKYALILNPDTEVKKQSLQQLVDYGNTHEEVALISPKIVNSDGSFQFGSVRKNPTLWSQVLIKLMHAGSLWKFIPSLRKYFMYGFNPDEEQDIEQVMGSAMFMRKTDLDEIGYFDERFFIWFEDVDLSLRFQKMNKTIRYYPIAEVIHHGGQSFKQRFVLKKQWFYNKSLIQYFKKHYSNVSVVILVIVLPINMLLTAIYQLLHRNGRS